VIVSTVLSHLLELVTRGSLDVNTTSHETVLLVVTETVAFVVVLDCGEVASGPIAKVSAERRTAPVQSPPACKVNDNDPFKGAAALTVAESFGSHVWADDVLEGICATMKHSSVPPAPPYAVSGVV
jgi:hypothetical protein